MADTQIATSGPEGSLPPTMINPDSTVLPQPQPSTLVSGLLPPKPTLPQSAFDPVVANLGPKPAPTPTPTPTPSPPPPPAQQPAVAPPTPLVPPAPGSTQGRTAAAPLEPPLAGGTVNWTGESDVLKQRVDALYASMPPELRSGTTVESGFRTLQQQREIYEESGQGTKFMAASPGHSHHEQGTALDWHFGTDAAKKWLYDNAPRFGLAFPFPDRDSGHMQLAEYGEGTQKGRAPQPGSASYLPDLEKVIDSKEGGFPGAVSSKGAEGTHQILLSTAQEIEPGITAEQLQNPQVNDRIFHQIVRNLSNRYPGDPQAVMVAYNAGPGVADKWLAAGRDPSVLSPETQKYIGAVDLVTGSPAQRYHELSQEEQTLLRQEIAAGQKALGDMQAGSPEQRALMDKLMQKRLQLMDKYEEMIAHPPTQKPQDAIGNFGSIATLIGIFAGRFAHRPMVASLNAAGAAMQAINDNNYQQYQDAFKMWKTQTDMTSNLLGIEASTYKDILDNKRIDDEERFRQLDVQMRIFQNAQGILASERGDLDTQLKIANQTQELADKHNESVAQIEHLNAETEKARQDAEFPLLPPVGAERSDLMSELQKKADEEAKNPTPGQTPRTAKELAQDPTEVQAARQRIELRKKDKPADDIQSSLLPTTGEDRSAIITELGIQATADVKKSNPDASPADAEALVKKRVQELANNYAAVDAARTKVAEQKGILRQGGTINDDDALIRAGQLMKGDTSGMIRLNQASRDKVYDAYQKLVMPQIESQFQKEEGHAPSEAERKNLLLQLGGQLATSKADFTGFTQYQRSLAIRQASIDTAIAEAQKVIPIAVAASDSVPRSQFPSWNAIQLAIDRGTGGEDVVKLNTATNSLAQIYARAVTPTGQATDLVRQKAYDNLTAAYSQGQYKAAVSIMQLEMDAAQAAPEQVRQQRREEFLRSGTVADTPFLQHGAGGGAPPIRTPTAPTVTPAWATGSASGPNNEQIYTDGKAWFHADHTPVQ